MEIFHRNVGDLDQSDRFALERVIGHPLETAQEVVIQVTEACTEKNGRSIDGELPDWCNVYEGLADEQIDDLSRSIVRLSGGRAV